MISAFLSKNYSSLALILFCMLAACNPSGSEKSAEITHFKVDSTAVAMADSLLSAGNSVYYQGDRATAQLNYEKADSIFVAQRQFGKAVKTTMNLSQLAQGSMQSVDSMYKLIKRAETYSQQLPEMAFERGHVYQRFADIKSMEELHRDAQYYTLQSLKYFMAHEDSIESAKMEIRGMYSQLASTEYLMYNYEAAEKYIQQGVAYAKENDLSPVHLQTLLLAIYLERDDFPNANALAAEVEGSGHLETAFLYTSFDYFLRRIELARNQGDYQGAERYVFKVDSMINGSAYGKHFTQWYGRQERGDVYLDQKNYEKALSIYEAIQYDPLEVRKRPDIYAYDHRIRAFCNYKLGNIEGFKRDIQIAINTHLTKDGKSDDFFAEMEYENSLYKGRFAYILYVKGFLSEELFQRTRDPRYRRIALHTFTQQHELLKEIGLMSQEDNFLDREEFDANYGAFLHILFDNWQQQPNTENFYKALTIADQSKSSAISKEVRLLKRRRYFKNVPAELLDKERVLQGQLDTLNDVANPRYSVQKDSIEKQYEALKNTFREKYPRYFSLSYGTQKPIQELISEHFSAYNILEYSVANDTVYVFNINEGRTKMAQVALDEPLNESLNATISAVRSNTGDYEENLQYLQRELARPFLSDDKPVLVVFDDLLHLLPDLLFQSSDGSVPVVLRMNNLSDYTPKLSENLDRALIMAPFAGQAGRTQPQLPGSDEEVKNINQEIGGTIKLDEAATKSAFLTEANNFSVIHIATHSELDKDQPYASRIYFSDQQSELPSDSELKLEEIYNLRLSADLVTLSSCESGIGIEQKGRGLHSISNAFNYAGVSATVMSLWKVPDRETSELMELFYTKLKEGLPKDEALQQAKIAYVDSRTDAALKHPFYWSGFVIAGDPSPIKISAPIPWIYWAGGGLALLIVFGIFYKRTEKTA